jgi:hypothetical protein
MIRHDLGIQGVRNKPAQGGHIDRKASADDRRLTDGQSSTACQDSGLELPLHASMILNFVMAEPTFRT